MIGIAVLLACSTSPERRSGPPADATNASLERALATYRAGYGHPWEPNGPQEAAMRVSALVFARLPLVGAAASNVRAWLGPPDVNETEWPEGWWQYTRGIGDVAVIYLLRLENGHVVSVKQIPSQ